MNEIKDSMALKVGQGQQKPSCLHPFSLSLVQK